MSLRPIAKIPSVAPTNGNGSGKDDDDDDDPSLKKKPSTLDIVKRGTIWLFRTLHGEFCLALGCISIDSRRGVRKTLAMIMNGLGFVYSVGVELLFTSRIQYKNQWLPLVEELNLFLQTSGISVELERGLFNYRFRSNIALLARIQDKIMIKNGATGVPPNLDRRLTCMASLLIENGNLIIVGSRSHRWLFINGSSRPRIRS